MAAAARKDLRLIRLAVLITSYRSRLDVPFQDQIGPLASTEWPGGVVFGLGRTIKIFVSFVCLV